MSLRRPFQTDRATAAQITLKDLTFACVATFFAVPALAFAMGALVVMVFDEGAVATVGIMLNRLGTTGLVAWVGIPVAILTGRFASQRGWIGWGFAPLAGATAGTFMAMLVLVFDGAFYTPVFPVLALAFALYGTAYASIYWLSLRWLRADVLGKVR